MNYLIFVLRLSLFWICFSCASEKVKYVCPPCNLDCDSILFDGPGVCPHCQMTLVRKSDLIIQPILTLEDPIVINPGSGLFLISGGKGKDTRIIKIHYYRPKNFDKNSKILLVIPGAGRNGNSYRDAWIEEADRYGILVLSPEYPEDTYPFEDYHLGSLIQELNLEEAISFIQGTNQVVLDENTFSYKMNLNQAEWIFKDFDRIFDTAVEVTQSAQTQYDLFGHSAGGQILHRMALLHHSPKVNRLVAANSGFYTLPDTSIDMPFGVKGYIDSTEQLKSSFNAKLWLLLGELDNKDEQKGTLLRSKTVDQQGLFRFARGNYFYDFAQKKAAALNYPFNWKKIAVPNVGHNHRKMGDFVARYLYSSGKNEK